MMRPSVRQLRAAILTALALFLVATLMGSGAGASRQAEGMPGAWSCDEIGTPMAMGTPGAMGGHEGHGAGMATDGIEFDQLYIDMMIPHHASIIALAEAAIPNLTDPWLIELAHDIIDAQSAENEQLADWRTAWYGDPIPAGDETSMMLMLEAMPIATMDEMMREMDAAWQVETFCAAADPDLAFIEQAIRHHQMAIDASEIAIEQAVHPELAAFAEQVIADQQAEIDLLNEILAEYEGAGTPVD